MLRSSFTGCGDPSELCSWISWPCWYLTVRLRKPIRWQRNENVSSVNCAFLAGRLSSTMIRGPTLSESDRHLCMWDERIRRHSCQTFPRKAPYSHEERGAMLRFLIPSFHSLPMHGTPGTFWRPRTACILWPCFSYGSPRSNCSWTSCFSFVTTKDAVYIASRTYFRWYRLRLFNSGCNRVLVMDVA